MVYVVGHIGFANYLLMPNISIAGELAIMGAAIIGALIGFLWYNKTPAQIFMGDTGSLILGMINGFLCIHFIENCITSW